MLFRSGWTHEKIKLPNDSRIGARVEGKSSLARIGLGIHVTAPTIHPGFGEKPDDPEFLRSEIRLEIWNIGPLKIRLKKGMPICQIIFEEVHGIPEGPYAGQFTVQGPPGGAGGVVETRTVPLEISPCTRYYLVAVKTNKLASDFTVRVDFQEPVSGCTPPRSS